MSPLSPITVSEQGKPVGDRSQVGPRTPLGEELGLSKEQSESMRVIWEDVRKKVDGCFVQAQELQKHGDLALFALLTDEQKAKYAKIQKENSDALTALRSMRTSQSAQVAAPSELEGESLSPNQVRLAWQPSATAINYRVAFLKGSGTPTAASATQMGNVLICGANLAPEGRIVLLVFCDGASL